jgi:hypothetical protein
MQQSKKQDVFILATVRTLNLSTYQLHPTNSYAYEFMSKIKEKTSYINDCSNLSYKTVSVNLMHLIKLSQHLY